MSTGPVTQQAKAAAGQTAGAAKNEAARTAQAAKDAAASTASTAGQEVSHVAGQAQSAAADVVGTTRDQVSNVAGEALDQVRDLTDQVRTQLSEQAGKAAAQLAQAVRSLADELQQMCEHSGDAHGAASQAAQTLSERGHAFATYLQGRDPEGVVTDLRGSAARKPGGFLLGAVLAGVLAGRLVKGGKAAADSGHTTAMPATPTTPMITPSVTTPVAGYTSGSPAVAPTPLGEATHGSTFGSTEHPSTVAAGSVSDGTAGDGDTRWLS